MYSVLVIFGIISLSFPISIVKGILRAYVTDYNSSMVDLVFYMVTVCSEIWLRPSSCTRFPVLNHVITKTCNETLEITRKRTCSNFL